MEEASFVRLETDLPDIRASVAAVRIDWRSVVAALLGHGIPRLESALNDLERSLHDAEAVISALFEHWKVSANSQLKEKFGNLLDRFHSDLHDEEASLFRQLAVLRLLRRRLNRTKLLRLRTRDTINAVFWKTVDAHNHMVRLRILCADIDSRLYPPDVVDSSPREKREAIRLSR